ncbi:hypothetical protein GF325_12080 [Candidatus Bathyarchaeota archaeon]|nr:hypothetical protein [Candidatus Bathyarchaeota archaeon]
MATNGNSRKSPVFLFLMQVYLKGNRSLVRIHEDRIRADLSGSHESMHVGKQILEKILAAKKELGMEFQVMDLVEFIGLDLDMEPGVEKTQDVSLEHLVKAANYGFITFLDNTVDKRFHGPIDRKAIDKQAKELAKDELDTTRIFLNDVQVITKEKVLSRYKHLCNVLEHQVQQHLEGSKRTRMDLQDAMKLTTVLPVKSTIGDIFGMLDEVKEHCADTLKKVESARSRDIPVDSTFVQQYLDITTPRISMSDAAIRVLDELDERALKGSLGTTGGEPIPWKQVRDELGAIPVDDGIVEYLMFSLETGAIDIHPITPKGKEKSTMRITLNQLVRDAFSRFLEESWPFEEMPTNISDIKRLQAILPKVLKASLESREQILMKRTATDGLEVGEQQLEETLVKYNKFLDQVRDFLMEMQSTMMGSMGKMLEPLVDSMKYQQQDIDRFKTKMAFYFQENKSQQKRAELRHEIDDKLTSIDACIKRFESDVGNLLGTQFVNLERLDSLIARFKKTLGQHLKELGKVLERYDAFKLLSIVGDLKRVLEKRQSTINLIRNMIMVDLRENFNRAARQLSSLTETTNRIKGISIEKGSLADPEFNRQVTDFRQAMSQETQVEKLVDEMLIKKQISLVEERLVELDTIKQNLEDRKDKLLFLLVKDEDRQKFIDERKVGECIICYEPITTLDENVIVCPHCGRIAHQLCLLWWAEKYSMCPVCHGKFLEPTA